MLSILSTALSDGNDPEKGNSNEHHDEVSALALMVAAPAMAQNQITGIEAQNDPIDDITDDVNDDLADGNDADRFGPNGVAQGWRGSFALSASGTSGNTDTGEVSGAGRLTYGIGDWNHLIGFAVEYGESNGTKSEEKFFWHLRGQPLFHAKTLCIRRGALSI